MSAICKPMFEKYINCYNAIQTLYLWLVIDAEERAKLECKLLKDIIEVFRSEVKE